MSADDYIVVRHQPDGWRWARGCASNEYNKLCYRHGPWATLLEAYWDADDQDAEYGVIIYDLLRREDEEQVHNKWL